MDDLAARRSVRAVGIRRLVIACWLLVVLVAVVVRYPEAFRQADQTAHENAALDLLDREAGGGNSVIPDQSLLFVARAVIPARGTFLVAVGPPREGWSDLTATYAETFLRYFLLPRRVSSNSRWVLCLNCDRSAYPNTTVVWEGDDGLSLLERGT